MCCSIRCRNEIKRREEEEGWEKERVELELGPDALFLSLSLSPSVEELCVSVRKEALVGFSFFFSYLMPTNISVCQKFVRQV